MATTYENDLYETHFNQSYIFYQQGLTGNLKEDIDILNTTIETLTIRQGNNWTGKGDLFFIKSAASIAAAEVLKNELEEQLKH